MDSSIAVKLKRNNIARLGLFIPGRERGAIRREPHERTIRERDQGHNHPLKPGGTQDCGSSGESSFNPQSAFRNRLARLKQAVLTWLVWSRAMNDSYFLMAGMLNFSSSTGTLCLISVILSVQPFAGSDQRTVNGSLTPSASL